MHAFCSAIKLACLKTALQALPCKHTAEASAVGAKSYSSSLSLRCPPQSTHRGTVCFGLLLVECTQPITGHKVSVGPWGWELRCALGPGENPSHPPSLWAHSSGNPPPLYCTSSSQSQQAHSEPFLGTVIIVIYVYGERHAPISSLCDTASKLVSPLLIACNIPAPSHIAFFSAHFFLMWGLPLLHQP